MCSNFFPNLTVVIYNIQEEFQYNIALVESHCRQIRKLLEPYQQKSKEPSLSHLEYESEKLTLPNCKLKLPMVDEGLCPLLENSVLSSKLEKHSGDSSGKVLTMIGQALKKGVPLEVLNGIEEVKNYINIRKNQKTTMPVKKFLGHLQKDWDEEFQYFMMFENDLGESLKHYLNIIKQPKGKSRVPERPDSSLLASEEAQNSRVLEEMKCSQTRVNDAILKDITDLDFSKLAKANKEVVVALHHILTATKDIKRLQYDYIISRISLNEENINEKVTVDFVDSCPGHF